MPTCGRRRPLRRVRRTSLHEASRHASAPRGWSCQAQLPPLQHVRRLCAAGSGLEAVRRQRALSILSTRVQPCHNDASTSCGPAGTLRARGHDGGAFSGAGAEGRTRCTSRYAEGSSTKVAISQNEGEGEGCCATTKCTCCSGCCGPTACTTSSSAEVGGGVRRQVWSSEGTGKGTLPASEAASGRGGSSLPAQGPRGGRGRTLPAQPVPRAAQAAMQHGLSWAALQALHHQEDKPSASFYPKTGDRQ